MRLALETSRPPPRLIPCRPDRDRTHGQRRAPIGPVALDTAPLPAVPFGVTAWRDSGSLTWRCPGWWAACFTETRHRPRLLRWPALV